LFETLNLTFVGIKASTLLLFEFFDLKLKALFLSILNCLSDSRILLCESLSFPLKLLVHFFLVLSKMLIILFLDLESLPFFFLSQLLFEESNLRINVSFKLSFDLAFFFTLVNLPLLALDLNLRLVRPDDLLLL